MSASSPDLLCRLDAELPSGGEGNPEQELRAVLRPLIERGLRKGAARALPEDPLTCPNCGEATHSERSPYCSATCRERAGFVRRFRAAIADRSVFETEKQVALGQALWALQGGGYPARQSMVDPKIAAKVIARDGGKCQVCGAPATEIDHNDAAIARGSG